MTRLTRIRGKGERKGHHFVLPLLCCYPFSRAAQTSTCKWEKKTRKEKGKRKRRQFLVQEVGRVESSKAIDDSSRTYKTFPSDGATLRKGKCLPTLIITEVTPSLAEWIKSTKSYSGVRSLLEQLGTRKEKGL